MELNRREANLIMEALKTEIRTINNMMQELERRGFHNGNQNVIMQKRMVELNDLYFMIQDQRGDFTE